MDPYKVIIRPVYTEKTTIGMDENDTYVFDVSGDANKIDVREAVESLWNVKVIDVRTQNVRGKPRRYRQRKMGLTRCWKKAYVRLAADQAIEQLR